MAKGVILVIGGLGVKGVANIGTLQSLHEHNVRIDKIVASGVSSIIAAQFALGRDLGLLTEHFVRFFTENERYLWGVEQLCGIVRRRTRRMVSSLSYFLRERLFCKENIKRVSILSWELVQKDLEHFFGSNTFSELKPSLAISAIDLDIGKEVLLREGNLVESLKAGIAFPGLFPPVSLASHDLVSSTFCCEIPMESLRRERRPIVAIDIPSDLSAERPSSVIEIIAQMEEIRSATIKHKLLSKADHVFSLDGLKRFRWGSYRQIPQMISQARENMNKLLDSVETPIL